MKAGRPPLAIVAAHAGREGVLRTRAVGPSEPVVLRGAFTVPSDKQTRLVLTVSHDEAKPWILTVNAGGKRLHQALVGARAGEPAWETISLDLSTLAGREAAIELVQSTAQGPASAYWAQVEVVSN